MQFFVEKVLSQPASLKAPTAHHLQASESIFESEERFLCEGFHTDIYISGSLSHNPIKTKPAYGLDMTETEDKLTFELHFYHNI